MGITTEYNVLWFCSDTWGCSSSFFRPTPANAFVVNQPVVFAGSIPIPTGQSTVQMVIALASVGNTANPALRYVFFVRARTSLAGPPR